jgi:hypothetical protein
MQTHRRVESVERIGFDCNDENGGADMVALVALVLILIIFGSLGFAVHVLWYVLILAVLLWLIGFFIGGVPDTGRRRWYGR